jgi:hypothetical protein
MENGAVILRFTDGILDNEKYMLLKKLAAACGSGNKFFIVTVSPDDLDMLQEMVTTAAFFINEKVMDNIADDPATVLMIKKLSIASKYALSGFKTVVDYGGGRQERECTLSIVTPCAHIHLPSFCTDKKTERYISVALGEALSLYKDGKEGYLIYMDEKTEKIIVETKDDYVKRLYLNDMNSCK